MVASGNFNIPYLNIKNKDEIGKLNESFNSMVKNVNELISSIKDTSNIISKSSQVLDGIVLENTAAINEVAASVDEIARGSSEQAVVMGGDGLLAIELLLKKSEENSKAASKVSDIILEVDRNSIEIGAITAAISQISEQTNLLALNAAIEAARATEQGKGFAVVAEEVRKLASQSALSASKVKELIDGIQKKSKDAVIAMEVGSTIAKDQSKSVIDVKEIFTKILISIGNISCDMESIKVCSVDMENEKNDIIVILETLSASTEENSAATQQVAATTEQQLASIDQIVAHTQDLKNLAVKLTEAVDAFEV